ncbi:MAG: hypothetical protein WAL66_07465 [Nitrososphaeraceae archaeon]
MLSKLKFIAVSLIVSAIAVIIVDIFVYPSLLPKIWTSQNSMWIQQTAYLFYIVIFIAITSTAIAFFRLLISNPLYRSINNHNTLASIITTFLSTQLPSLTSHSSAKHEMITNGHGYTTKRKSDGSSSHENNDNNYDGNNNNNNNSSSIINSEKKLRKGLLLPSWSILVQLAFGNKRYFGIFLIATIIYGILFSQISSILVYRSHSFKYLYGIDNTPSLTTITYGPVGYAPALSVYITDHIGLFIFPINLLILIAVSVLVGFNIMFSIFALRVRAAIGAIASINSKRTIATIKLGSERYHTFLKSIAYVAGLFTACPTCASYYIFGIIFPSATTTFGSFTLSIASFTSTYYLAIFASSLVVLIFSPFITAATIRKYLFSLQGSACKLEGY